MYVKSDFSEISKVMKWRYLDSLDSTRYSKTEFVNQGAPRKLRIEQAAVEMMVTMLMGNGVIVPNNQLIDSIGFLRIASSMIDVAVKSGVDSKFIPILYANYDYSHEKTGGSHLKDPFLLAAYLFDKDGFELSSFPELGERRREWATCLGERRMGIPSRLLKDDLEAQLASDLIRILDFFSINNHRIVDAVSTKGIREFMTGSIANVTTENLENDKFFVSLLGDDANANRMMKLTDIIKVFVKIRERGILDNRTEIRKELIENEEFYFKDIKGTVEITRIGVLKTFNSIYNFSGYKSTRATQDNQTEPLYMDNIWGPDEAAFALGRWARENYESSKSGEKARLDILSNQDLFIDACVNEKPIEGDEEPLRNFWKAFFEHQQSKEWETSLTAYINSLHLYEKVKQEYDSISDDEKTWYLKSDLMDTAKQYEECRAHHINTVNDWLPNGYKVVPDEHGKLILTCLDDSGKIISKVQVEDFAEHAMLTKIEKGAYYASEVDKDVSAKGCTAEYGE